MEKQNLNTQITKNVILLNNNVNRDDRQYDRQWTQIYRLMQSHPALYRNQNHRYPDELFKEGVNMAWAKFDRAKITKILKQRKIAISIENSDRIVSALITYFNQMAIGHTIDIWRKETYRAV